MINVPLKTKDHEHREPDDQCSIFEKRLSKNDKKNKQHREHQPTMLTLTSWNAHLKKTK